MEPDRDDPEFKKKEQEEPDFIDGICDDCVAWMRAVDEGWNTAGEDGFVCFTCGR